jgi:hypothetical protein
MVESKMGNLQQWNTLGRCVGSKHLLDYNPLLGLMQDIIGALHLMHQMKMPLLMLNKKTHSTMHKPIFKDVELATRSDKEKFKRNKLGSNARKFRKQHS